MWVCKMVKVSEPQIKQTNYKAKSVPLVWKHSNFCVSYNQKWYIFFSFSRKVWLSFSSSFSRWCNLNATCARGLPSHRSRTRSAHHRGGQTSFYHYDRGYGNTHGATLAEQQSRWCRRFISSLFVLRWIKMCTNSHGHNRCGGSVDKSRLKESIGVFYWFRFSLIFSSKGWSRGLPINLAQGPIWSRAFSRNRIDFQCVSSGSFLSNCLQTSMAMNEARRHWSTLSERRSRLKCLCAMPN